MNYLSRSMSAFSSCNGDGIVNQEEIKFPEENDQNYDNTLCFKQLGYMVSSNNSSKQNLKI